MSCVNGGIILRAAKNNSCCKHPVVRGVEQFWLDNYDFNFCNGFCDCAQKLFSVVTIMLIKTDSVPIASEITVLLTPSSRYFDADCFDCFVLPSLSFSHVLEINSRR